MYVKHSAHWHIVSTLSKEKHFEISQLRKVEVALEKNESYHKFFSRGVGIKKPYFRTVKQTAL